MRLCGFSEFVLFYAMGRGENAQTGRCTGCSAHGASGHAPLRFDWNHMKLDLQKEGEEDSPKGKKSKRVRPKKAKHKHEYKNIVIEYVYPENYPISKLAGKTGYALESYCPICGKIGCPQKDEEVDKKFPDVMTGHFGFIVANINHTQEYNDYLEYCMNKYPRVYIDNYLDIRYNGQVFIDLDAVVV